MATHGEGASSRANGELHEGGEHDEPRADGGRDLHAPRDAGDERAEATSAGDDEHEEEPYTEYDFMDRYLQARTQKRTLSKLPGLIRTALDLAWTAGRREFAISVVLSLFTGLGAGAQLLVGRDVLADVLAVAGDGGSIWSLVPSVVTFGVLSAAVQAAATYQGEQTMLMTRLVGRAAFGRLLDVAGTVGLEAFESPNFYDRLQRARDAAQVQPWRLVGGLIGLLGAAVGILGVGSALVALQPLLFPLIVLGAIPLTLANRKMSRESFSMMVRMTPQARERSYVQEVLLGRDEAKELRSFNLTPPLRRRFDRLMDEFFSEERKLMKKRLRLRFGSQAVSSAVYAVTIGVLVWLLLSGRTNVATTGAAAIAIQQVTARVRELLNGTDSLYECALFLDDYASFMALEPRLEAERPRALPPSPSFDRLAAEGVTFCYPGSSTPALHDVDVEIGRGEVIALVGENGSGKTTLAKLLCQLYRPTSGRIMWDGADTADIDPAALRESIAVIFQDFVRYQLPARENVGFGRQEQMHDLDAVVAAARHAGADDFLAKLPNGYDTILSKEYKGGRDLSVGQWQRVALARAFFRDASFIVLDEPTAALDPRAEHALFQSIRTLCAGRSVLLISHRFSSVRNADRIYVLDKGRVVEHGSHRDLMAHGGTYAELFTLQASAYLGESELAASS